MSSSKLHSSLHQGEFLLPSHDQWAETCPPPVALWRILVPWLCAQVAGTERLGPAVCAVCPGVHGSCKHGLLQEMEWGQKTRCLQSEIIKHQHVLESKFFLGVHHLEQQQRVYVVPTICNCWRIILQLMLKSCRDQATEWESEILSTPALTMQQLVTNFSTPVIRPCTEFGTSERGQCYQPFCYLVTESATVLTTAVFHGCSTHSSASDTSSKARISGM